MNGHRREVFIVKHAVGVYGGGIVRTVLSRSQALSRQGCHVTILTLDEQDYRLISLGLRLMQRLPKSVRILNLYEYYRDANTPRGHRFETVKQFALGTYLLTRHRFRRSKLHLDTLNDGGQVIMRRSYHRLGFIAKHTEYHPVTGNTATVKYLTLDGFCFLEFNYDDGAQLLQIALNDTMTNTSWTFANAADLHRHWFEELCRGTQTKPFLISDSLSSSGAAVLGMDKSLCHRIYTVHSNHHDEPLTPKSKVKPTYELLLNRLSEEDALVVPTHAQQRDVLEEFGDYHNTHVIPHFTSSRRRLIQSQTRQNTVVMVSRYHADKGLDEAIYAFEYVLKELPEAKLEIYGAGSLKANLRQWVTDRNLANNVRLYGYRSQVDRLYARGCCTLVTSKCEGFCLAILESMWHGTPVLSYDVPYGPSELIKDGFNGHLVPYGDREALANHIIALLHNPKQARELGDNARGYVRKLYNESMVVQQWIRLFNDLETGTEGSLEEASDAESQSQRV
jgi:glycosyltransferase involved in cell wall biosynthesis